MNAAPIEELEPAKFGELLSDRDRPAVFRGLVSNWPIVDKSRTSLDALAEYLKQLDVDSTVRAFVGQPGIDGRFFYGPNLQGFNFGHAETKLNRLIETLLEFARSGERQSIYMGSTPTAEILPRFASDNPLTAIEQRGGDPRIWIGNDSRIAPHFDEADNVACVVSGTRRFTLFPPDQVRNLYVGPIDRTPAGQPTSLVDLAAPDFERFPRFREAAKHAQSAELGPGDAIFIPSLWWHGVQSSGPLNVLVNYWWQDEPLDAGSPLHALGHGLLTIANLAPRKREGWRHLFDHYVFRADGDPAEHIPEQSRGILGRSTVELRETIRQFLIQRLMGR